MDVNAVFQAVYDRFAAGPNALSVIIEDRLRLVEAMESDQAPYAVFFMVYGQDDSPFRGEIYEYMIQFNMFAEDPHGAGELVKACSAVFHGATIHGDGIEDSVMVQGNPYGPMKVEDNLWQASLEFVCRVETTNL